MEGQLSNQKKQPPGDDWARRTKSGGLVSQRTITKVPSRQVYLFGVGQEIDRVVVDADLHDTLYLKTQGGKNKAGEEIPPDLEICCPRCEEVLHIDGTKKKIRVWYLDKPRKFAHPWTGDLVVQTAVVSVEEVLQCPRPEGKTICGIRFKITNNRIHRV